MKFSKLVLSGVLGIALLSATSCGTPKNVAYFQDLNNNPDTVITLQNRVITVKPTDKIYVGVKSKDPQISQLFNSILRAEPAEAVPIICRRMPITIP